MKRLRTTVLLAVLLAISASAQKQWTLEDCITHSKQHSTALKQQQAAADAAVVSGKEARAAWQPSLLFSTSQSVQWRPFQEDATGFVNGTTTSVSRSKTTQSGNYGINAAWTVWNGGRREATIKRAELETERTAKLAESTALSLEEQITSLYIQILYSQHALRMNENLLANDKALLERGKEMLNAGQISKSDLAQLESNAANGEYDVVNARTQITSLLTSLKQLLELPPSEPFDIQDITLSEQEVRLPVEDKYAVYQTALARRPEIAALKLAAEQSELQTKTARAGRMPSISLTAGLGDNHVSGSENNFWKQMKLGFAANMGISLSIPILDNRSARSAVERAKIGEHTAQLDLKEGEKSLWATIENHWTAAVTNQQKFVAATASAKSAQTSYDYTAEAFRLGTKNIADLTQSRDNLLRAQNEMIQAQYLTLLYKELLKLYNS